MFFFPIFFDQRSIHPSLGKVVSFFGAIKVRNEDCGFSESIIKWCGKIPQMLKGLPFFKFLDNGTFFNTMELCNCVIAGESMGN